MQNELNKITKEALIEISEALGNDPTSADAVHISNAIDRLLKRACRAYYNEAIRRWEKAGTLKIVTALQEINRDLGI